MSEFFNKIKEEFNKNINPKKKIENLVFFLVLLIIVVIAINFIWRSDENKNENLVMNSESKFVSFDEIKNNAVYENVKNMDNVTNKDLSEYKLKGELENILSNISGAGKVQVLITYTESSQIKPLYNENIKESTTEETDSSGGIRTIGQTDSSKEVVYVEESGKKVPITEKVIMPKIEGAIILAEGANDSFIKNNIIEAVQAVTGLEVHKIQVFKLKNN